MVALDDVGEHDVVGGQDDVGGQVGGLENDNRIWYYDILWAGAQNNFNNDDLYPYADYNSGIHQYEGGNDDFGLNEPDWIVGVREMEDWDAELDG